MSVVINMDQIKDDKPLIVKEITEVSTKQPESATEAALPKTKEMGILKIAIRIIKMNLNGQLIFNQMFNLLFALIEMSYPFLYGKLINCVTEMVKDGDSSNFNFYVYLYLAISMVEFILRQLQNYFLNEDTVRESKMKLTFFKSLLEKDIEFYEFYKPGEILNRFNGDFFSLYFLGPEQIMMLVLLVAKLLAASFTLFCISQELFFFHIILYIYEIYKNYRDINMCKNEYNAFPYQDKMACQASEIINNIKLIKSFSLEKKEYNKMKETVDELSKMRIVQKRTNTNDLRNFLWKLMSIIDIWYAANKILQGQMDLGQFTTFQILSQEIKNYFPDLTWRIGTIFEHIRKCERIFEFLDYEPNVKVKENSHVVEKNLEGEIEFKNVSFSYPLRPQINVLKDFNLKIQKGEVVAMVGASGSGKSTIASLILRLYDPKQGGIFIDGVNVADYDLHSLHKKIGYVPQEPQLFSETIENNITYSLDTYTLDELKFAATLSNAEEFINNKKSFPDGYKTMLGNNGLSLSGGQKQRIAIARILIKNANILIFDEATSALDASSEHEVQTAIDKITKQSNITTIIIAHRLSTIKKCDRIIVMKQGEIIEQGNHQELLQKNGEYKNLVIKQLDLENVRTSTGEEDSYFDISPQKTDYEASDEGNYYDEEQNYDYSQLQNELLKKYQQLTENTEFQEEIGLNDNSNLVKIQ